MDVFRSPQSLEDPLPGGDNTAKKTKGILDFFSSASRVTNLAVGAVRKDEHVEDSEDRFQRVRRGCETESKTIPDLQINGRSARALKLTKKQKCASESVVGQCLTNTEESESVLAAPSENGSAKNAELCMLTKSTPPAKSKKKRLATKKKGKVDNIPAEVLPEQKGSCDEVHKAENKPQEIDYAEFVKAFAQKQNETESSTAHKEREQIEHEVGTGQFSKENSQNGVNTKHDGVTEKKKDNGSEQSEAEIKQHSILTCNGSTERKATEEDSGQKGGKTSSTGTRLSDCCKPEQKKGQRNPPNAFSLLMQARPNKEKDMIFEDETGNLKDSQADCPKEDLTLTATDDEVEGTEQTSSGGLEKASCPSTPSVMRFFSKCTKKSVKKSDNTGGSVVVEVDIHISPEEQKIAARKPKSRDVCKTKLGKTRTAAAENDSDIVFLGSETIDDECCVIAKKTKTGSKSKGSNFPVNKSDSKTTSTEVCTAEDSETIEDQFFGKKSKTASKSKGSDLPVKNCSKSKTATGTDVCTPEESAVAAKRKEFLQNSTPSPDTSKRRAQPTLQFGKGGGLGMNTSVLAKPAQKLTIKDKGESEDESISSPGDSNKRARRKQKPQRICETDEETEQFPPPTGTPAKDKKITTKLQQKKTLTRLRKSLESESGSDSKDFTPKSKHVLTGSASKSRAQELLQKAKLQKGRRNSKEKKETLLNKISKKTAQVSKSRKQPKPNTAEIETPVADLGSRRQSRRLAEQQVKQEAEQQHCINVESDSSVGGDEVSTPKKTITRKKDSSRATSSPRKPAGKLAPIFAKKKPAEAEESAPVEDPELVRKRREFLMSGVPTELTRPAVNASPAIVASEPAPFPEISHVQQRTSSESGCLDVWSLRAVEKIQAMLRLELDPGVDAAPLLGFKWESLQWQPTSPAQGKSVSLLQHPSTYISSETPKLVLQELVQTNPSFPFSALHDKFKTQLSERASRTDSAQDDFTKTKAKRSSDSDIIIVDDQGDASNSMLQNDKDGQWSDVLQPVSESEVIGNKSSIRRLKYWLEEWKALIQREARVSAKAAGGGDSDFDFSGDDSDDEGSGLCNTILLVGPHGVGKTAAVYALAQQLSYKVFEVNASSSRQGRHILAQLQEATQSHQVAQKKEGAVFNSLPLTPITQPSHSAEQPQVKKAVPKSNSSVPKAFASFFKSNAAEGKKPLAKSSPAKDEKGKGKGTPKKDVSKKTKVTSDDSKKTKETSEQGTSRKRKAVDEVKGGGKKRRGEEGKDKTTEPLEGEKDGEDSNFAGYLNLTSTSLILFDEVDLVFEEDSGFLQTVQHFISTTKIPIIMTTSDPGFHRHISAKFETLVFKQPSSVSVASYLQTVSLAAGMRVCARDMSALAALCKGDLRQSLLSLQFLALSGGGRSQEARLACVQPSAGMTVHDKQQGLSLSAAGDGNDSEGDFVCLKPARKRARRIMDDDENSVEAFAGGVLEVRTADDGKGSSAGGVGASGMPLVHLHLCESMSGVSCDLQNMFSSCVQNQYNGAGVQQLTIECLKLQTNLLDALQSNLLRLLPLPKTAVRDRWCRPASPSPKSLKRKRIRSDIYDSEASDEENVKKTEMPVGGASLDTAEETKHSANIVEQSSSKEDHQKQAEDAQGLAETTKNQQKQAEEAQGLAKTTEKQAEEALGLAKTTENRQKQAEEAQGLAENTEVTDKLPKQVELKMHVDKEPDETPAENKESEAKGTPPPITDDYSSVTETEQMDVSQTAAKDSTVSVSKEAEVNATRHSKREKKISLKGSRKCTDDGLGSQLLSSFAQYYESLSVSDSLLCDKQCPSATYLTDRCSLLPGTEDLPSAADTESTGDRVREEILVQLSVHSSRRLWQSVHSQVSSWKQEHCSHNLPDGCSIPVSSQGTLSDNLVFGSSSEAVSVPETYKKLVNTAVDSLPLMSFNSLESITLDYLPTLRAISQAERCRQIAKTKRRFHHYFDNIGLCLSEATLTALCAEFPPEQQTA
ncbi:ATPase family AAA domain-containing protein 5-like [Littorina saxatilis]|uniref:AAA+ ATPase domain-containing protein n=1 Tax=Littorina saxatilis TaxID=31220 RepID=A0AAN9BX27_9CAEN